VHPLKPTPENTRSKLNNNNRKRDNHTIDEERIKKEGKEKADLE
jgi:hypothetical protein